MERRLEEEERELLVGESPKGSGPLVLKDMWRLIKSGHHLGYRDFEIQGSTPFHPRYARCEGAFGCGPTVIAQGRMERRLEEEERELPVGESPKGSGPLVLKDTWRLIKSGPISAIATLKYKGRLPSIHDTRDAKAPLGAGPRS
jgi:hypothetical protein